MQDLGGQSGWQTQILVIFQPTGQNTNKNCRERKNVSSGVDYLKRACCLSQLNSLGFAPNPRHWNCSLSSAFNFEVKIHLWGKKQSQKYSNDSCHLILYLKRNPPPSYAEISLLYKFYCLALRGKKKKGQSKQKKHNSYLTFAEKKVLQEIVFPVFIYYLIYKQNAITERNKRVF